MSHCCNTCDIGWYTCVFFIHGVLTGINATTVCIHGTLVVIRVSFVFVHGALPGIHAPIVGILGTLDVKHGLLYLENLFDTSNNIC